MFTRISLSIGLAICALIAGGTHSIAQEPAPRAVPLPPTALEAPLIPIEAPALPLNPYVGDFQTRQRLTGDWGGTRSAMADRGLVFNLLYSQFYQGVTQGGLDQNFEYGGKLDYLFHLDSAKLGLWQGFFLDLNGETRYGRSVNQHDSLLTPATFPLSFPESEGSVTALTGVKLTQALSETFMLYAGKINTLDEYCLKYQPIKGAAKPGLDGFMNTSLVMNPIIARTIPYSAAGVGFAYVQEGEPVFTFSVFDPEERVTEGVKNMYERGVVLCPDLILKVKPNGLPGMYNFGGTWSNAKYRLFEPAAHLNSPFLRTLRTKIAEVPEKAGSWSVYADFYQSLWADPNDEERNWGLFGQFGVSDGNPNPIRYVASGGIGGRSPIPGRDYDVFGVGYFYLGLSDQFKQLARFIEPQRDEYGVELFYNAALTPWARLTGDLQIARPSTTRLNTVVIPGIRFQLIF